MASTTNANHIASTSNTSSYTTASFTPAADDLLVAFVIASDTTATGSMSDSQSGSWDKITSATRNSGADTLYLFVRTAGVTASSMTVTFDCTGDNASGAVVFVVRVAGASAYGSSAVVQSAVASDQATGTPSHSFSGSCTTTNVTLGFIGHGDGAGIADPAAPTGWTDLNYQGYSTPLRGGIYCSRNSGFTGTTMAWNTSTSSEYGAIIVELDTTPVAEARVTSLGTDVAIADDYVAEARVTSLGTDVAIEGDYAAEARITSVSTDVAVEATYPTAVRVTNLAVESATDITHNPTKARITNIAVEPATEIDHQLTAARITNLAVEVVVLPETGRRRAYITRGT